MNPKKHLSPEQRRALLATPAGWLACGFGSGLTPVAQGTFGSLAALLPWLLLRELSLPIYLAVLLLGFAVGVWACNVAGRAVGVDDHRSLVWDEFIGQWIALIPLLIPALLPLGGFQWWMLLAGFALFNQHPQIPGVQRTQCLDVSQEGRFRFKGGCFDYSQPDAFAKIHTHNDDA